MSRKLYVIVLLSSFIALLITSTVSMFRQDYVVRKQLSAEIETLSVVIDRGYGQIWPERV